MQDMLAKYHDAKFITVMSDGSTDKAILEQEIIYIKFALKGEQHTYFVSVEAVTKPDAQHISKAIDEAMAKTLQDKAWKEISLTGWLTHILKAQTRTVQR